MGDHECVPSRRGTSREKNGVVSSYGVIGVAGVLIDVPAELEKLVRRCRLCDRPHTVFGNL